MKTTHYPTFPISLSHKASKSQRSSFQNQVLLTTTQVLNSLPMMSLHCEEQMCQNLLVLPGQIGETGGTIAVSHYPVLTGYYYKDPRRQCRGKLFINCSYTNYKVLLILLYSFTMLQLLWMTGSSSSLIKMSVPEEYHTWLLSPLSLSLYLFPLRNLIHSHNFNYYCHTNNSHVNHMQQETRTK